MEAVNERYTAAIRKAEEKLLHFLRTMETHQEELHLSRLAAHKTQLQDAIGDPFPLLKADLSAFSPPEPLEDFHATFSAAISHCADAYQSFLRVVGPDFPLHFLKGRHSLCSGQHLLYKIRAELPLLQQYWILPDTLPSLAALETRAPDVYTPVGMIRKEPTDSRGAYSLYVPENYTPQKTWPLIVCLHGGYGRDDDYILTWLRPAKSKGYLLLSPKSLMETWSAIRMPGMPPNPLLDLRSIRAMLDEVCDAYAVNRHRVYATGFSDGAIFTHILGLAYAHLFAGIAPIASQLHPAVYNMVQRGRGKDLPLLLVHGGQDPIFPIASTRQTRDFLTTLGYPVTYHELPDWGHAYPYTINETLVLPWFEGIGAKPDPSKNVGS